MAFQTKVKLFEISITGWKSMIFTLRGYVVKGNFAMKECRILVCLTPGRAHPTLKSMGMLRPFDPYF